MTPDIISPQFIESVVLATASWWIHHLYRRVQVRALLYVSFYTLFPALGLLLQSFGAPTAQVNIVNWFAVVVNATLTIVLVRLTWFEESPTSKLLTEIALKDQEIARLREAEARARAQAESVVIPFPTESNSERVRQILSEVSCG